MTSEINRCYRALELEPGASLEQVKQAWRELVKVWHPDRFPNDAKLQRKAQERLKEINLAYEKLQEFLASGAPPPHNRASSSQTSAHSQQQNSERPESGSKRTETPPPRPPPPPPPPSSTEQTRTEPKKSSAGVIWAVVGGVIVLLLIVANSGKNPGRFSNSGSSSYGTPSGGSAGFTPPPPQAYVPPPVAKALDEKNGFKDFKFGMTPQEAREILPPTTVTDLPGANAIVFHYQDTPANRIGEFSTDTLSLRFFDGRLYRIDIKFSGFPNEIFEACKVNYGEPSDDDAWTRGDQKLKGKSWRGQKVYAVVLSPPYQAWDSLIICDIQANQTAQEFAAKEPERAAKDFGPSGFKSLVMGTKLSDLTVEYEIVKEDRVSGVREVAFRKGDWRTIGFYPLRSLSAEFFNDRLYRINLGFEENRKEISATFEHRFGPLQDNDGWTGGTTKWKAKSATKEKLFAVILAPQPYSWSGEEWNFIMLYDVDLWREAEQFKKDAPKRAAKDF